MPMSLDDQARKGKELLAEAIPYLLQSGFGESEISEMVEDLVADWEEGQTEPSQGDGVVRRLKPGRSGRPDPVDDDPPSPWRDVPVRTRTSD